MLFIGCWWCVMTLVIHIWWDLKRKLTIDLSLFLLRLLPFFLFHRPLVCCPLLARSIYIIIIFCFDLTSFSPDFGMKCAAHRLTSSIYGNIKFEYYIFSLCQRTARAAKYLLKTFASYICWYRSRSEKCRSVLVENTLCTDVRSASSFSYFEIRQIKLKRM